MITETIGVLPVRVKRRPRPGASGTESTSATSIDGDKLIAFRYP